MGNQRLRGKKLEDLRLRAKKLKALAASCQGTCHRGTQPFVFRSATRLDKAVSAVFHGWPVARDSLVIGGLACALPLFVVQRCTAEQRGGSALLHVWLRERRGSVTAGRAASSQGYSKEMLEAHARAVWTHRSRQNGYSSVCESCRVRSVHATGDGIRVVRKSLPHEHVMYPH